MQGLKDTVKEVKYFVDVQTGDILAMDVNTEKMLVGKPEEFFLMYTSLLNIWESWNLSVSDLNLYAYLCCHYGNGSTFSITTTIKEELGVKTGKHPTSFNNSTRALLGKMLIVEVGKKAYKINPRYMFKGSSKSRNKALFEILLINKDA